MQNGHGLLAYSKPPVVLLSAPILSRDRVFVSECAPWRCGDWAKVFPLFDPSSWSPDGIEAIVLLASV